MTAQLDDTMFNIQCGHLTTRANNQGPCSTSFSPMDDSSTLFECDYTEHVAAQNNIEMEVSHILRHLTMCLMVIQTRQRNHPLPQSFPIAPMSQLIPACEMATLRQLLSSELMNFFIVIYATWHACYNIWPAFLSKETLMNVIATILHNLNYLENLSRTLFLLFSNLGRINYTHLVLPLSGITSKLILATSRIMIIIHMIIPPLRKLSTEKSFLLFHPVPLKNK